MDGHSATSPVDNGAALHLRMRPVFALDDAQFLALCQLNKDLRIERTADGGITALAPTGGETGPQEPETSHVSTA